MRRLLGWASFFSCVLIFLTALMWHRSRERADWLRVAGRKHAAVMTTSRDHIGAAFVSPCSSVVVCMALNHKAGGSTPPAGIKLFAWLASS